ncbi:MAG: hypothetical protein QFF03_23080 [Pseudomonadota bacterium]|nr:hypothetical protein [Pseudomonadota bacterium]
MILLQHIDAIARARQRAVLYLEFHPEERASAAAYRYERDVARDQLLTWLDTHGIIWQPCGPWANIRRMESYRGQVYVDVPFDETLPLYCLLRDALEHPDGSMKLASVRFMLLTLARAMENADHDAPGFWDQWADTF